jgi:hypothetical protein
MKKIQKNEIFQLNDKENKLFTTFNPAIHTTVTFFKYDGIKQP